MADYSIHILKLIAGLSPHYLRQNRYMDWMDVLLSPFQHVNDWLVSLTHHIRYRTAFTGQVILLEHLLNDIFDPVSRGIYITDGNAIPISITYLESEINTPPIYTWLEVETQLTPSIFTFMESELEVSYFDFVVHVPIGLGLVPANARLHAWVKKYKIAGKRYTINLY
jgi:hypothetical protein